MKAYHIYCSAGLAAAAADLEAGKTDTETDEPLETVVEKTEPTLSIEGLERELIEAEHRLVATGGVDLREIEGKQRIYINMFTHYKQTL